MTKQKIAILGGGVSAMTSAFYLTQQANWQDKYDITVYQQGWRLGGKGASGRNAQLGERIEEHGLHVWFGAYVNSFKTIEAVYDQLARPAGVPLATWQDAFKPHSFVVLQELIEEQWDTWSIDFPQIPGNPANGTLEFHFWEIVQFVYVWLKKFIDDLEYKGKLLKKSSKVAVYEDDHEGLLTHFYEQIKDKVDDIADEFAEFKDDVEESLAQISDHIRVSSLQVGQFLQKRVDDKELNNSKHHSALAFLLRKMKKWLVNEFDDLLEDHDDIRRIYICVDLGLAILTGLLDDKVYKKGFGVLNQYDFRQWLLKSGANDKYSVHSAPVRGFYDLVFAYEDGNFDQPNVEAGVACLAMLRIALCYRGGVMWKMQAGMGDTIFSPMYELLSRQGVKFEFFNQVTELVPGKDLLQQDCIEQINLVQQVTLINPDKEYVPLVDVKGLACWPSAPLLAQIDPSQAALITEHNINLEAFWSTWPHVYQAAFDQPLPTKTLQRGVDFDEVIFGISVGGLPHVAAKLLDIDVALKQTSEQVKTVATQAFQLWLDVPLQQLGWTDIPDSGEEPILSGFSEPFDTWASMDQLICRETWSPELEPKNVAYFCSALPMDNYPPQSQTDFPDICTDKVKDNAIFKLKNQMFELWPDVASEGEFEWQHLIDPQNRSGEARFDSQYWRANVDPSERYVLSVTGSSAYRLDTDGSIFQNLYLTGDWIKTGVNAGCVEAAVMAGMQTSRAISGYPTHIDGENGFDPD
ncbi:NAD(P)-binding protein [Pseudoalteromonas tunicata]|uniref:NAD(P)-binding protein n=1 Tax=Pseudoalteromonas tunicata TaxID=314281 RepID=UPI00273FAC31|nr:NAD(P)-binding protein [Pseudoalteromonas tunicata]MDP5211482.1 NAD(P)-binding protein [Pseudoalteromonas tunicata]